jgi:TolB-like protein
MASLIEGYEYDIFISYRQKDNKHDGWVTEFVNQLKGELESTFKEEISVYFDINPHDGLLETHDVDASLKEKLKCLVFIPIISRTYCDPKSFAWVHEFKAFIEQASRDQFGLKVKLPGGNVTNRVLPVQIHDLDTDDKKLVESELGTHLRGIEFIYKEPGVNKPLTSEDDEKKNLNNTKYRIQINKVANATKEIISAIRQYSPQHEKVRKEAFKPVPVPEKKNKTKIIAISIAAIVLIILGLILTPKIFRSDGQLQKSIAVLPFHNYSGDPNQEYMSDGLTDEIINHLYKIKSFDKVVSLSSVLTYKGTGKKIPRIADELKVNYILEGTYKKIGDQVRVTAQLIEPKNDKHLWQQEYDQPYKEIISIQSNIALQIAANLHAFLTSSEKQIIQKIPTNNLEAYDYLQHSVIHSYTFGKEPFIDSDIFFKKGKDLALKAIEIDPNYSDAYAWAGLYSLYFGSYAGTKELSEAILDALPFIEKALELDQNNSNAHFIMGIINEWGRYNYIQAEKEYLKSQELAPNKVDGYGQFIEFYIKMNQLDKVQFLIEKTREKNISISKNYFLYSYILSGNKKEAYDYVNSNTKLPEVFSYKWIGEWFIWLEEYDSARIYLETALKTVDTQMSFPRFQAYLALAYQKTNNNQRAKTIINELIQKSYETSAGSPEYFIGWYYSGIGEMDSAFYWLEKAYNKRSAEMPWLKVDPVFKNIKIDNRYRDLYQRTGHKAYDDYIKGQN